MSLFSRNTGGGRRGLARMAAVFTGTLFVYLFVTAIPAMAATTCAGSTSVLANDTLNLSIGTDDHVVLAVGTGAAPFAGAAGEFNFSVNTGAFASCGAAVTTAVVDWVNVTGSDAGAETFTMFHPSDWANSGASGNSSTTVDLGNGTDSLVVEYGALATPAIADPAAADTECLGTAVDGTLVGDQNCGGVADLRIDNAENITINGGDGADTLDAGNLGGIVGNDPVLAVLPAVVSGDDIPDADSPFAANLTLNGGNGDDFLVSGDGNDNFQGGPGADGVSYEAASGDVTVDLTAATGTGMGTDTLSDVQDATGGDFNDTITGNSLDNMIFGGAGDDTLAGVGGNDTVDGEAGDDTIVEDAAANGADLLSGGPGTGDTLDYGARTADITIVAGGGNVSGASGEKDTVDGSFESYITGSGNDSLTGAGGDEFFDPGSGTNTVDGDGDSCPGVGCGDYLDLSSQTGPATIDLSGGAGTATAGTTSDDFTDIEGVVGTSADDTLNWDGTGALVDFAGGPGEDTVDASASTGGVVIDLADFGNSHETENAIGGSGDDELYGNVLGNMLIGNDGVDIIDGYGGNDWVEGGLGNDSLDTDVGNTGADTLVYVNSASGENIDNQLGFATGGDGQDSIGFFAIILGSDFNDTIVAGQNSVGLNQRIRGRAGNDNITGSNSSDVLSGGGGNDNIRGGGGDDTIRGAAGNDYLYGSSGDDFLFGGKGTDHGNGGSGDDRCKGVEYAKSC